MALDGDPLAAELPAAADVEGFRFEVGREIEDDVFEIAEEIFAALFIVLWLLAEELGVSGEVGFFEWAESGFFEKFSAFCEELFGSFFVLPVGHGKAEVSHDAVGIMGENLTERALGFIIPEAVELADALIEIGLSLIPLGRDGEVD